MKKIISILFTVVIMQMYVVAYANTGYGIELTKDENNIVISSIIKNSQADKAGIKEGQKITSLNGKQANKLTDADIKHIDTYNDNTKYNVKEYKTDKIILAKYYDENKHAKYANAYFNYADSVSITNSKIYTELFNITRQNVNEAIKKSNNSSQYKQIYNKFNENRKTYGVTSNAFKTFLELAIYSEQNKDLINKQISELNSNQKKLFAKYVYNTRVVANLYHQAKQELTLFSLKNSYNPDNIDKWQKELITENELYNIRYKELSALISKNKIVFNKPGALSNHAQTGDTPPTTKWLDDKQIVTLAQAAGYNPQNSSSMKKYEEVKKQKQAEKLAAEKKAAAEQAAKAKAEAAKQAANAKAAQQAEAQRKAQIAKSFKRTGDYTIDAGNALLIGQGTGDMSLFFSIVNEGINIYEKKLGTSYENNRKYCELLALRFSTGMSLTNPTMFMKDQMNLDRYCKYM